MKAQASVWFATLCALSAVGSTASATDVTYDLTSLGGNEWQYSFTVSNNSLSVPVQEFTVFFDPASFTHLTVGPVQPAAWPNPLVVPADPAFLPDLSGFGFFDTLAADSGISPGAKLAGFSVDVDFLGSGTPGGQVFEVIDPGTFSTLERGETHAQSGGGGTGVAEPSTGALFCVALIVALRQRLRHQRLS
jgi:hypothetical protein